MIMEMVEMMIGFQLCDVVAVILEAFRIFLKPKTRTIFWLLAIQEVGSDAIDDDVHNKIPRRTDLSSTGIVSVCVDSIGLYE
jgi:hypothetical protein